MLTLEDLLFVNFVSETTGDYVTLNIDTTESPYNTLTVAFDQNTPSGTTVTPKYSIDGGVTWKAFTNPPTVVKQSTEYSRYTYNQLVSASAVNKQLKLKLEMKSENRFVRPRVRRFTAVFKDEV